MAAPLSRGTNITWHESSVTEEMRNKLTGQKGATVWLTGLSGSGKSTIGVALEAALLQLGKRAFRLDGDNVRFGLNKDLGFSEKDRNENIRRIGEVSKLFASSCTVAITAFISPYKVDRETARKVHEDAGLAFIEVFVDTTLEEAEKRDPKGLYKKARAGEIKDFTGISAPYEAPSKPEVHLNTNEKSVDDSVKTLVDYLQERNIV